MHSGLLTPCGELIMEVILYPSNKAAEWSLRFRNELISSTSPGKWAPGTTFKTVQVTSVKATSTFLNLTDDLIRKEIGIPKSVTVPFSLFYEWYFILGSNMTQHIFLSDHWHLLEKFHLSEIKVAEKLIPQSKMSNATCLRFRMAFEHLFHKFRLDRGPYLNTKAISEQLTIAPKPLLSFPPPPRSKISAKKATHALKNLNFARAPNEGVSDAHVRAPDLFFKSAYFFRSPLVWPFVLCVPKPGKWPWSTFQMWKTLGDHARILIR